MSRVWHSSKAHGTELLVLLALADHADDLGHCFPSIRRIARLSRVSENTVRRALKRLQEIKEVAISGQNGPNGVNRYQVLTPSQIGTPPPKLADSQIGTPPPTAMAPPPSHSYGRGTVIEPSTTSCSKAKRTKATKTQISDEQWLESLKSKPEFNHIDFTVQLQKAHEWIQKNKGRQFTRRFFENWLSRVEKPVSIAIPQTQSRYATLS